MAWPVTDHYYLVYFYAAVAIAYKNYRSARTGYRAFSKLFGLGKTPIEVDLK
jgi:hypothetical protein